MTTKMATRRRWSAIPVSELSAAEKLLIDRRRRQESQRDAAERLDLTLYRYRQYESGAVKPPRVPALHRLRKHEICFLRRAREGLSLKALAAELDISDWWLCQIEYGKQPADRLLEYWGAPSPS